MTSGARRVEPAPGVSLPHLSRDLLARPSRRSHNNPVADREGVRVMVRRPLLAVCVLSLLCGGLAVALRDEKPVPKPEKRAQPVQLPGVQKTGELLLPNQWSLRPAGKQIDVGDFPVNIA